MVAEIDCSGIMVHFNTQLTRHNRGISIMITLEYKHQSSRDGQLLKEQHQNQRTLISIGVTLSTNGEYYVEPRLNLLSHA